MQAVDLADHHGPVAPNGGPAGNAGLAPGAFLS